MKAKDTVMNKRQIIDAVLSNKAGYKNVHTPKYFSENIMELRAVAKAQAGLDFKAGMRKVVDWVEQNSDKGYIFEGTYEYDTKCDNQIFTDLGDWQDKLKEWGVNK